jgi:hypothetical protein
MVVLPSRVVEEIQLKQHVGGCGCYTTCFEGHERVGRCSYLRIGLPMEWLL